ncbi:MAG: hypothetical protein JSV41_07470, partial [Gemmatimonadota bacterium]
MGFGELNFLPRNKRSHWRSAAVLQQLARTNPLAGRSLDEGHSVGYLPRDPGLSSEELSLDWERVVARATWSARPDGCRGSLAQQVLVEPARHPPVAVLA